MKLATFLDPLGLERLGVLLKNELLLDVNKAYSLQLRDSGELEPELTAQVKVPPRMIDFLRNLDASMGPAKSAIEYAKKLHAEGSLKGNSLFFKLNEVKLRAPIPRPGKMIFMGWNFLEHAKEQGRPPPQYPRAFLKTSTTITGPFDDIIHPKDVQTVDHEVEVAMVIGKRSKRTSKAKAMDHVAGFMVVNDISVREVQFREAPTGMIFLGKNFDTSAPMGPFLTLKEEISDPHNLRLTLKVNGDVRQESNTNYMYYKFEDLVEYFSQITLEPGDVITSGTPPGVASGRKPDPSPYYLKPGDLVETSVEGLGTLRNRVVSES